MPKESQEQKNKQEMSSKGFSTYELGVIDRIE